MSMASSCFMDRVRGALVVAALGGAGGALVHCGSMSESATAFGGDDGGTTADSGGGDGGGFDSSASDSGVAIATLLAVHASPDLSDFRICLGGSSSADGTSAYFNGVAPWPSDDSHPMPMANYAGIAVGRGAALPRAIVPNAPFVIPYLIDAHELTMLSDPKAPCNARVGPGCPPNSGMCLRTSDYVALPAIPTSLLLEPGAKVLAIVGCKTPGNAACGTAMGGTLRAAIVSLSPDPQASVDQIGVQLAHLSFASGSAVATLDSLAVDAGPVPLDPLTSGPSNGLIITRPPSPGDLGWGNDGVAFAVRDAGLRMSLADMQRIADPSALPSVYFTDRAYVFVLVGDPNANEALYIDGGLNPKFDGTGLHVTAISTTPGTLGDGGN
jgi:hypothetical protein